MRGWTEDERTLIAVSRYEIIAPIVTRELPRGARSALIKEQVSKFHLNEKQELITISERTIERYLSNYRNDGLEGLKPVVRSEKNSLKAFSQEALDAAIELRLARSELSADSIISILQSQKVQGADKMCVSTLNRHFYRLGKDRPALKRQPRKRYQLLTVDGAHQLWICDIWDGPSIFDPLKNKKRRLRLVAIIDSHTRKIIQAEFYFNENRPCLEDALLKAILKYGIPERFYCDNAKIFQSNHLKRIAAELGFRVQHSQPYKPQGRGKIERWFRTVADKFEPLLLSQLEADNIKTLVEVNRFLIAWVEEHYHQRRHGSLKMSPAKAMEDALTSGQVLSRQVDPETVREAFLWREKRLVTTLATVKIFNNHYQVDDSLMGKDIEVRYNPYNLNNILIFHEGQYRCKAEPYKMKNFVEKSVQERQETAQQALDAAMDAIVMEHLEHVQKKIGVSYAKAMEVKNDV